jgi:hypothetical protein
MVQQPQNPLLGGDEPGGGALARMLEVDRHDAGDAAGPRLHDDDLVAEIDRRQMRRSSSWR